ncbi:MAG: hypothetical protein ACFFEM_11855 [Candidatus Thorarchaeota archaeon]
MIVVVEWLNNIELIVSSLLFLYFYVKCVSPAQMEKKIGEAYIMCIAEERDLVIRYGAPYLDYRGCVGFAIPKRSRN